MRKFLSGFAGFVALVTSVACSSSPAIGVQKPTNIDLSVCDPETGTFSTDLDHPYLPLPVGTHLVYRGIEDGTDVVLDIDVLDQTEVVAGVTTRVVREQATEDGELHEVADNFFVQAADGSICYFGETTDFYKNGKLAGHEGAWRTGVDGARPGIIMPAMPMVGMSYDQERAEGVSQDHAEVVSIGEAFDVPAGRFEDTLDTEETSPLDPGVAESKRYALGVGLIVSGTLLLEEY